MQCGLFGKLSSKRDLIALSVPKDFLKAWEPWMQSCISASRDRLGESWLQSYVSAPIWRFWLGADICGTTVVGALMPSLDGVGRYYPLTLLAQAPELHSIAPPDLDAHDQWFATSEEFLLSTLDNAITFEAVTHALNQLPPPDYTLLASTSKGLSVLGTGVIAGIPGEESFSGLFESLRTANHAAIYAGASFWWTMGGDNCQPFGFSCHRLPDPSLFVTMLTGVTAAG
jgi:type VI secretion system protein ImpM